MITIQITHIPAKGTVDPWEAATTTIDGATYSERSRSCAEAKLARSLVAAGIPDQPWQTTAATGTPSLRGPSIHRLALRTVTEADRTGLRWAKAWDRSLSVLPKDGA